MNVGLPSSNLQPHAGPRPILVFGLLALVIAIAYGINLRGGFVYDDVFLISKNGLITRLDTLPKLLTSDYWVTRYDPYGEIPLPRSSGLYRPLVFLTYAINYAIGGLEPVGYHLVNILIHLGVTWMLYLLALQLRVGAGGAVIASVLFALHPIHTEAVTNVVGRAELLMSLGVLASLWLAAAGRHGWSFLVFGLSLFCKEQAMMLPALVMLYDLCAGTFRPSKAGKSRREAFLHKMIQYGAYGGLIVGYLLARSAALGGFAMPPAPMIDNPLSALEGAARVYSTIKVDGRYLLLFFWPAALSVDYSYDAIPAAQSFLDPGVLFGFVAWGTLVFGALWAYFRGDRRVAFSLGFTILLFFPVSNVLVLIGTIMGERLFYLPSAGLCLLAGIAWEWTLVRVRDRRAFVLGAYVLLAGIGLSFTARTVMRNLDWYSDETAFQSALQVVPRSAKVHAMLGVLALPEKKWDEADQSFETAFQIYPAYSLTDGHLLEKVGGGLLGKGDIERATDILERAVALERDSHIAHHNLGLAYSQAGRYEDAERAYRKALALDPKDAETYISLSYVLTKQQRYSEAAEMAEEAIRAQPDSAEAHYNRGRALEGLGHIDEALAEYARVVEINPAAERVRERRERLRRN